MTQRPSRIVHVTARQIFDSRGRPTVEADVTLEDGCIGRASVPSGSSTGRHEAYELRDGDPTSYGGKGVLAAARGVRGEIAARLLGRDALDQRGIDRDLIELDGSPSLSRLGANAILASSLATARAAASHRREPLYRYLSELGGGTPMCLPMPMANVLSGGAHVRGGMDFQDFLAVPVGATSYSEALAMIWSVNDAVSEVMRGMGLSVLLASDGGLSPGFPKAEQALELMVRSFETAGLRPGIDVAIALDVAASELVADGSYRLSGEGRSLSREEMIEYLAELVRRFPIVSVEDALEQDDWEGFREFAGAVPGIQVAGDDLFATNLDRIQKGIAAGAANAALIKLNQNGTLTGTLDVLAALRSAGLNAIVAGRSGDTEDTFVADLAVGAGAGQVKFGAFRNTERVAKYNQLFRIEEEAEVPLSGFPQR